MKLKFKNNKGHRGYIYRMECLLRASTQAGTQTTEGIEIEKHGLKGDAESISFLKLLFARRNIVTVDGGLQ